MADLLELSRRFIDEGVPADSTGLGPVNRVTLELSEVADGVAMVEAFSHVVGVRHRRGAGAVRRQPRRLRAGACVEEPAAGGAPTRSHTLVYTHGHVDHVGGSRPRSWPTPTSAAAARPDVVGHEPCPTASIATTSPTATTR